MDPEKLYETLRKIQEPKGYFFNKDTSYVLELLSALILNKDRYGHMACPCRLASGDKDTDRDILCPCVYREPDVKEYGSCYCGLYGSKEWSDGKVDVDYVPERRPAEKMGF